ncbi:MAG: SpoIIE family protein phosphatase, partial [Planctomycetota bacterium]
MPMLGTDAFLVQQEQEPLQLDPNGEQVLGRSPEAAISVTNTMVSRRHCVFSRQEDGSWLLIDCGSRNGVLVNGQRVRDQQTMEHQDIVNVAGEQWVFLLLPAGQRPDQAAQGGNGDGVLDTMELEDGLLGGTGTHLANELERASQIQRKMLVPPPEVPGWNIGVDSEGLGSLNGDFYDIAALPDGRIQILLGDVCGHGIHAALFGTTVLKSNRLLREDIADPRELLVRLNNEACRDTISGHFATVFLAYLHPPSGQIEVLIAGHHDAFLYRAAEGRVERLGQRGVALGITQAEAFEKGIRPVTAHLAQGDMLLQVTDGFLESENEAGEAFDDAGLETFLLEHHADPDLQISTQALNQAIHAHCPDIQDDLTVIALRADAAPDPDLSPHVVPSVAQLEQQATRRIAYYLCQSAHQQTRLMPPRQYLIGRSHEADIQIVDPHVSRRHCLVVWDDERTWLLRDIGSCNPLVVNGRACSQEEVPLCDGDRLQVGSEEYIYRVVPAGVDLQKLLQEADDEALLATIEREPDAPDERDLQGAIDGRGIIDLLQYCRMINRNGCLHVAADEDGRIWLLDGVPVHAVCGAATGLEAILTLITGGSRSFVLHEQERCQERSIAGSFEDLLAALVRAIDDRNRSCPKAAVDLLDTENQPASEDLVIYETPPEEDDAQATAVHASTVFESGGARGSATEIMAAAFPQGALAGRQLGQVKLGICIGRGANAEVYRGRHALLDIDVAVKVLKTGFDEIGQKAKDRLLAEAKLAARVRHQAVVQMID